MSKFNPIAVVWEITMGCNMRCKHCGSSCQGGLPDELTTEEALDLCDQLASLGVKFVNLSGGEPLLRNDWDKIATRLMSLGVQSHIISNGWLIDDEMAKRAYNAGIKVFAISLDGLQNTHDYMRCDGSFDSVMQSLRILKNNGVNTAIITTINKRNLPELTEMKDILKEHGIGAWQLQIATPMGSFHGHRDELMIEPHQVNDIINLAYKVKDEIKVCLGDCVGYYSNKEHKIRENFFGTKDAIWVGCAAGKYSLGILHNGDITGCNSIRSADFIEGNIRNKSLKEIWESGFAWNREFSRESLSGMCIDCQYASYCLGGCPNMRLCLNGAIQNENTYCAYHNMITSEFNEISIDSIGFDEIVQILEKALKAKNYNLAIMLAGAYMDKNKDLTDAQTLHLLNYLHYAYFRVGRYEKSRELCERALAINNSDSYALHGLAISLFYAGDIKGSLNALNALEQIDTPKFKETLDDLCIASKSIHKYDDLKDLRSLAERHGVAI